MGKDLNPGHPEYKTRVRTNLPRHSVLRTIKQRVGWMLCALFHLWFMSR
jgi:hypothetical protein